MKILLSISGDFIAPRFDLSPEVIIATCYDRKLLEEPRSIIISDVSAERLCDLALQENVDIVICGGIEEQYYKFLTWKKVTVIDAVIGSYTDALHAAMDNALQPGAILSTIPSQEGS